MISFNGDEKRIYSISGGQTISGLERSPETKGERPQGKAELFQHFRVGRTPQGIDFRQNAA